MMKEEVASLIRNPSKKMEDFIVVDVRRNDHAVSESFVPFANYANYLLSGRSR
jgi:hypothetical protein